jgi:fatty acid desaturase
MFQRMIEDFKESTATTMRLTSLVAAAAVGLFITTSFLCAAAFVFVLDRYGLVPACLTGAAIFFVVTLMAAVSYIVRKREIEKRAAQAAQAARSAVHSALADPMLVATGLQLVRAIGFKRLLPILAVGGLALGFLASRQAVGDQAPAE